MVLFNYSTRELTAKVVYYGPGLCGKTTNLQFVYKTLPDSIRKGKMLSLATKTDRTLFFDFLPIELGRIRGLRTRIQLYTVPGQVFYNSTRKLVLKGADAVVFVADSQKRMLETNQESLGNLEENLQEQGLTLKKMPLVLQFNKRDLSDLSTVEEMNSALNPFNAPFYESVATTGIGVEDTLKAVIKLVLVHLSEKYHLEKDSKRKPRAAYSPKEPTAGIPSEPVVQPMTAEPVSQEETPVAEETLLDLSDAGDALPAPADGEKNFDLEDAPIAEPETASAHPPAQDDSSTTIFSELGDQEVDSVLDGIMAEEEIALPKAPPRPGTAGSNGTERPAPLPSGPRPLSINLVVGNEGKVSIPLELQMGDKKTLFRLKISVQVVVEPTSSKN